MATQRAESHCVGMSKKPSTASVNNLRAWREFRGLTQEQLAEIVGTAGNVIGLLESGGRGLSSKWLMRLAPALGTTPGFLLDHDPNDIDASFLDAAMAVPAESRAQVKLILDSFKKPAAA